MITSRGTTPTFEFVFPELITAYSDVDVTWAQNGAIVLSKDKTALGSPIKGTTYAIKLTQQETNKFDDGVFECQVRVMKNGTASASLIYRGRMIDVLNDAVLEDANG